MTLKISDRELERLLRQPAADLRPPADLLARLRAELPAELPHDLPPAPPAETPDNVVRPIWGSRTLLSLAATLAVVVGGSFLALRTFREMPAPGAVASDLARDRDQATAAPPAAPKIGMGSAVAELDASLQKEAAPVLPVEVPEAPAPSALPPPPPAPPPLPARVAPPRSAPRPTDAGLAESRRFDLRTSAGGPPPVVKPAEVRGQAGSVPGASPGGVPGGIVGGIPGGTPSNSYGQIRVIPVDELNDENLDEKLAALSEEQQRLADAADDKAAKAKTEPAVKPQALQAGNATFIESRANAAPVKDQPVDLRDAEGRRRARQLESPSVQGDFTAEPRSEARGEAHGGTAPPPAAAAAPREPRSAGKEDALGEAWGAIENSLTSGIWPSFEQIAAARQPPPGGRGKKAAGRDGDSPADPVLKLREDCLDFFGKMEKNRSDLAPLRRRAIKLFTLRPNDPRLAELVRMLNLASGILPD